MVNAIGFNPTSPSVSWLLLILFDFWLQVKFTTDCPAQGNRNYIPVSDLYGRNFTDTNGEFQLELSIGHVRTLYDTEFRVPTSLTSRLLHHHHQIQSHHNPAAGNALQHQYGTASPRGTKCKLETSYFTFGGFDWNLALYPHGVKDVSCKYLRLCCSNTEP